jgi:hypothetical protein
MIFNNTAASDIVGHLFDSKRRSATMGEVPDSTIMERLISFARNRAHGGCGPTESRVHT